MIQVNKLQFHWQAGMTVESLLDSLKNDGRLAYLLTPAVMVIINEELIPHGEYGRRLIQDGDVIKLAMFLAGG